MADVLLIIPPGGVVRYPNLGIGYLAAVLLQRKVDVKIIDCVALGYCIEDVLERVGAEKPRIIGINVYSSTMPQVFSLIQGIQIHFSNAMVVLGGAHFNASPESLSDFSVKYAFHGDCEYSFADFCERELGTGKLFNDIDCPGLIYRIGNGVKINDATHVDLDKLPLPSRHLFPLEKYFSPHERDGDGHTFSIITSRGCPNRCIFCCNPSRKVRYRSSSSVIQELVEVVKLGANYVEFVDDMFIQKKERIFKICNDIKEQRIKVKWGIQTPLKTITEDVVIALKEAGCIKISIGVESGVDRIRERIKKPLTNEQIMSVVKLCNNHKISVLAHYIFGHPSESLSDMKETIRFACKLNTEFAEFNKCVILPNTELFDIALSEGKVKRDHWRRYMMNEVEMPLYLPDGVTKNELDSVYKRAILIYYLRPRFILHRMRSLSNISDIKHLVKLSIMFIKVLLKKGGLW